MHNKHINKTEIRIIYADTDQMGVVYHANYLKFFEIGRTEFTRELGISYKTFEENNIFLPVKEAFVDYKKPFKYDDIIVVHSYIGKLKNVAVKIDYEIYHKETNALHTAGYTLHPFVNSEGRIVKPQDEIYNVFLKGR